MSTQDMIEGRKVPMDEATKADLREFAKQRGVALMNFDSEERIKEKLYASGWHSDFIVLYEGQEPAKAAVPEGEMAEPMVSLTIHQQEGKGGQRPIFVGVNGVGMLIPRLIPVNIKLRYYEALKNASETQYEYDENTGNLNPREVPSYPFQVHALPSKAELQAWHDYKARKQAEEVAAREGKAA